MRKNRLPCMYKAQLGAASTTTPQPIVQLQPGPALKLEALNYGLVILQRTAQLSREAQCPLEFPAQAMVHHLITG